MHRLLPTLCALFIASPALATPYTLELQATGAPNHSLRQRGTTVITDSWSITGVVAPPRGTTSWDVEITLPGPYRTVAAPEDIDLSVRCGWGTLNVSGGRQQVDGVADWHPDPLVADTAEFQSSGSGGDRNALIALFPAVPAGSVLASMTSSGTLDSPVVVTSPTGQCDIEFRLSGDLLVEDQVLLEPAPMGLSDITRIITDAAQDSSEERFPPSIATPPDAIDVEASLTNLMDALTDGGCLVDPLVPDGVGGAYGGNTITGSSRLGTVSSGALDRSERSFTVTLANGLTYGGDGFFGSYNPEGQVVALASDGSFLAGRWTRLRGIRGAYHTLVGTCDGASDATTVLDNWFVGGVR